MDSFGTFKKTTIRKGTHSSMEEGTAMSKDQIERIKDMLKSMHHGLVVCMEKALADALTLTEKSPSAGMSGYINGSIKAVVVIFTTMVKSLHPPEEAEAQTYQAFIEQFLQYVEMYANMSLPSDKEIEALREANPKILEEFEDLKKKLQDRTKTPH